MAGVNRESKVGRASRSIAKRVNRRLRIGIVRVAAGVQLDSWNPELLRLLDRHASGIYEETHADPGPGECLDRVPDASRVADDVEPALGRYFLAALGNECDP